MGDLNAAIVAAKKAIATHAAMAFTESSRKLRQALSAGKPFKGAVASAFIDGVVSVSASRHAGRKGPKLEAAKVFSGMQFMPKTLRLVSRGEKSS